MFRNRFPRVLTTLSDDLGDLVSKSWLGAFWACALAILVLALIPVTEKTPSTGWDVNDHALAFTLLTALGLRAYPRQLVNVVLGLIAFGLFIEVLQSFTPHRVGEWRDVFTNCFGIALGCMLDLVFRRSFSQQRL